MSVPMAVRCGLVVDFDELQGLESGRGQGARNGPRAAASSRRLAAMRHPRTRLAALVLPLLAFAACQSAPPIELRSGLRLAPAFDALNPSDIAILPIQDGTPERSFSPYAREMRRRMAQTLVERLYSPLGPDHVDRILAESAATITAPVDQTQLAMVAGRFQADAVLGVQVSRWDTSRIDQTDQVDFSAEVLMLASGSKEVLWTGRVEGRVKAGGAGPAPIGHEAKIQSAVEVFADSLARELPIRRLGTP